MIAGSVAECALPPPAGFVAGAEPHVGQAGLFRETGCYLSKSCYYTNSLGI